MPFDTTLVSAAVCRPVVHRTRFQILRFYRVIRRRTFRFLWSAIAGIDLEHFRRFKWRMTIPPPGTPVKMPNEGMPSYEVFRYVGWPSGPNCLKYDHKLRATVSSLIPGNSFFCAWDF